MGFNITFIVSPMYTVVKNSISRFMETSADNENWQLKYTDNTITKVTVPELRR